MNRSFPIQVPDYNERDFEHQNVNEEEYASYVNDIELLNKEAEKYIEIFHLSTDKLLSWSVPEETKSVYRKQRDKAGIKLKILAKYAHIHSLALQVLSIENE
jgi:hypothetical protein